MVADGRYTIGMYALRSIEYGEELTFDYSSVLLSLMLVHRQRKRMSVCHLSVRKQQLPRNVSWSSQQQHLCPGNAIRAFIRCTGVLDIQGGCEPGAECGSEGVVGELRDKGRTAWRYACGCCVEAPQWLRKWTALVLEYVKFEAKKLPAVLLKTFPNFYNEESAHTQAEGVEGLRIQNLAITLDRVIHVLRQMKTAEPPIHPLTQEETYHKLWVDEASVRCQLEKAVDALECEICDSDRQYEAVRELRREVSSLFAVRDPYSSRGYEEVNAAIRRKFGKMSLLFGGIVSATVGTKSLSDILLMYANTTTYFTSSNTYERVVSREVEVRLCDVTGEKSIGKELDAERQAATVYRGAKEYDSYFVLAQLGGWFKQSANRSNASFAAEKRGTLCYPDLDSFIGKSALKPIRATMRQVMKMSTGAWKPPASHDAVETKRGDYPTGERDEFYKKIIEVPSFVWPSNNNWTYKNKTKLYGSLSFDSIKAADEANDSDKWRYLRKVVDMIRNNIV
eukprot:TRINITY_DN5443_c0_g1_i9.p1 TRINITY_DN5443_c0_g1~~TRINITY_DN5443_c0_g1_i9.p1  ORF type:complete len:508 (-),score=88.05 TRINITY_DN5443_c0_g1_i9:237-1760(-)